ncbi:MAG: acetate/propionate family kinase [Burkholderiales bacterium]|nr:acetate/propionate family kinase [Burkholderiales bacterium]
MAANTILTVNGGSSSIKFALFDNSASIPLLLRGQIERIGGAGAVLTAQGSKEREDFTQPIAGKDFPTAITGFLDWIRSQGIEQSLIAVGHRIVHGGSHYHLPQRVTPQLLQELHRLVALAPAHLPSELLLLETLQERMPAVPQIACFDTAFHHDMPRVAQLLPIPNRNNADLRRYGFHGLSYAFLLSELLRTEGTVAGHGRIIMAHLGNGTSLAAVRDGKSIDTSMGFTPASGVMMATRSGDVDPGLAYYLARTEKMYAAKFEELVTTQSGLLGVSGTSGDMRDLLQQEGTNPRAAEAVTLYCYQIKKCLGAYTAALGGLDTLIFSGGIGENAAPVRARICEGLTFLGIEIDAARNNATTTTATVISTDTSRVKVHVIPTFEEIVIARAVAHISNLPTATT